MPDLNVPLILVLGGVALAFLGLLRATRPTVPRGPADHPGDNPHGNGS